MRADAAHVSGRMPPVVDARTRRTAGGHPGRSFRRPAEGGLRGPFEVHWPVPGDGARRRWVPALDLPPCCRVAVVVPFLLCVEHGVSRSWLIRAALSKGLPHVFDELFQARVQGFSARGARAHGRVGDRYLGRRGETLLPVVFDQDDEDGARVDQRTAAVVGRVPEEDG